MQVFTRFTASSSLVNLLSATVSLMQTSSYDILRRDALGQATWIETLPGVDAAKARVLHLAERFPAEYVIFHRATAEVVAHFHFKAFEFRSLTSHIAEENLSGT